MSELKEKVTRWDLFVEKVRMSIVEPLLNLVTVKIEIRPEKLFRREIESLERVIEEAREKRVILYQKADGFEEMVERSEPVLAGVYERLKKLAKSVNSIQDPAGKEALMVQAKSIAEQVVAQEQQLELFRQHIRGMKKGAEDLAFLIEGLEVALRLKSDLNELELAKLTMAEGLNVKNDMIEQAQGIKTTVASVHADEARMKINKIYEEALTRDKRVERATHREKRDIRSTDERVNQLLERVFKQEVEPTTVPVETEEVVAKKARRGAAS